MPPDGADGEEHDVLTAHYTLRTEYCVKNVLLSHMPSSQTVTFILIFTLFTMQITIEMTEHAALWDTERLEHTADFGKRNTASYCLYTVTLSLSRKCDTRSHLLCLCTAALHDGMH